MKKIASLALIILLTISTFALFSPQNFQVAHASTEIKGVLKTDTTWTRASSPYTLAGPVLVDNMVTLTIEPGVVVNLNNFKLEVKGALIAKGSTTDSIKFNNGQLTFFHCTPWSEQTSSGTIIEKALLNNVYIKSYSSSIKINNNTISGGLIQSQVQASDADMNLYLMHKKFETTIISNNYIIGGTASLVIEAHNTDIVQNNKIICTGQQRYGISAQYYSSVISNTITGSRGYGVSGGKYIADNTVSGFEVGIGAGYCNVTNNYLFNNIHGLNVEAAGCVVKNNTITNNEVGVYCYSSPGVVNFNNFESNSEFNLYLDSSESNENATFNWWGTTDSSAIDQKIRDYEDDFSLGKVTYMPFLTELNLQAMPNISAAKPETITNSENQNQTFTLLIALSLVAVVLVVVTFVLRKRCFGAKTIA